MSTILHITASIRGDESISRALSSKLVERLSGTDTKVITRDLSQNDIPYVDADRFAANLSPYTERSPEQQELAAIADTLIEELQAADTIVLGVPIYNFSVPATVKAWADTVARAGTTFEYTPTGPKGKLDGKKAYITVASGGTPVGSEVDFMSPWLKFFLGFLGISEVEVVATADGIMGEGGEEKIASAHKQVEQVAA
ncbi:FMN-dependent NADH-azoreductase [Erythrobacter litoralis]|uniref:FMN-dependent NADH:quinone oxidoreductase n=1 Tax=Erythrobacter litoralis (strain HTCC2594) TaxID=314225 RepID=AZOR_ERYLH|nr:NAD(P)H-dependent oxidoreductase [Erythrobacter litoralis]Q2N970.1 RecName: Full=FMN-dependent NADH:quinone oxidoreductase; AltName: Full=Azo-dye reductase; AltName: Full=FMN-dependent NADH-azo compound oxidoreductase; AltName: Full=FMN-dependent NADH-azoreductase [Erythrobacter litoralis HTCC2594]ABC63771.1 FMN-dependent NADH-azoreductase [Erythrobacter litoralis HTCC2594]